MYTCTMFNDNGAKVAKLHGQKLKCHILNGLNHWMGVDTKFTALTPILWDPKLQRANSVLWHFTRHICTNVFMCDLYFSRVFFFF